MIHSPSAESFPPIDERLVQPETREEIVRGRRVYARPAEPPRADCQSDLNYVIHAHLAPGYVGSTKLLTRASAISDFATDTCVRKKGIDEATGSRYLEELAFYVVDTQSMQDVTERAEDLSARGVRRLIAIFIEQGEVKEWSPAERKWQPIVAAFITDPCFIRPICVKAFFHRKEADREVTRALLKKNNPVLLAALREDIHAKGSRADVELAFLWWFDKRLGRALSEAERSVLAERIERLGQDRLGDVLLSLSSEQVADWFANPNAT